MKKVLIVDPSEYITELKNILEKSGFRVELSTTAFDSITLLKSQNFDLVITDVDLPGDNSFELYFYISKNYPYLPIIMLTEKNMDDLMDEIFQKGIGNVLKKPTEKNELIRLSKKLTGLAGIFGIENYIDPILEHKKIRINSSKNIQNAIEHVGKIINGWGFHTENEMTLNLILNELIINAIYHSHGYTEEKIKRLPVKLKDNQFVDINFGYSPANIAISVTDYNGTLSKMRILESIYNVVFEKKLIENFATNSDVGIQISETGRGIELVRQLVKEYYFIIKKNVRTEIILVFNKNMDFKTNLTSSLKILEFE